MLKHEGAENFNWNYVDQHVLGYQDFAELPEVGASLSTCYNYQLTIFLLVVSNSLHDIKSSAVVTCCCQQNKCGWVNRTHNLLQDL